MGKSLLDRLEDKLLIRPDGCWEWSASRTPNGYGHLWVEGKYPMAHRVIYELLRGPIPEGLSLDHLCRNHGCVNPGHLEPVTNRENIRRGEGPSARCARVTHCPKGHAYTPANTRVNGGSRVCRTCSLERDRGRTESRREAKRLYMQARRDQAKLDAGHEGEHHWYSPEPQAVAGGAS